MSGIFHMTLRGGGSGTPNPASFRIQTSNYGLPIPIVYGMARVGGNLVHYLDPKQTAAFSQQPHSKFIAVQAQQTGWNYSAAIAIALAEGPIDGVNQVYADKNAPVSAASLGFDVSHLGTISQAAWSYLTTNHPTEAVPYQFIAYAANPSLQIPNNVLPNYSWELLGLKRFSPGGGINDAVGSDILTDYLTDAQHGVGWPSALIGSLTSYLNYCAAFGLFVSPVEDQQRPAADFLTALMQATNSALVWSDGVLKVIPYGDQSATANGFTFTPNTTPLYDLTDDDYLKNGDDDPVLVTRKAPSDRYNQVFVEYEDRANNYNTSVAEAKDQGAIDAIAAATGGNGLRPMPKVSLPMIKTAAVARAVAQFLLQRAQYICNTYAFRLGWRFSLLEPMDLVTLTDSGLGLSKTPVRITAVEELGNDDGFQITAEDWPFGVASATQYTTASGSGFQPNQSVSPGNTTTPVIFEAPAVLQQSALDLWIAASGGANWGGCDVWASTDNTNFVKVGTIVGKANYGTLTASLATNAAYPTIDNTHTLAVDLTTAGGALVSYSGTDFGNLVPLCYVDGEFLAFENASLSSAFHYNLTTLYRGLYGSTIPASHASGANFVLCDGAVLRLPYPQGKQGQTVYFKFPAFNVYGQALQDISGVSSVSHVIGRTPATTTGGSTNNSFSGLSIGSEDDVNNRVTFNWTWGGDVTATFQVFDAETGTALSPATSAYSADGSVLVAGTTSFVFQSIWDLNSAGTHSDVIGFYVVAYVGGNPAGTSATTTLLVHRN